MKSFSENFRRYSVNQLNFFLDELRKSDAANENFALLTLRSARALFRAVHTIKGTSAALELLHIRDFAHEFEDFLEVICYGAARLDADGLEIAINATRSLLESIEELPAENSSPTVVLDNMRQWILRNSSENAPAKNLLNFFPPSLIESLSSLEAKRLETYLRGGERLLVVEKKFATGNFAETFRLLVEKIQNFGDVLTTFPAKNIVAGEGSIAVALIISVQKSDQQSELWLAANFDHITFDTRPPENISQFSTTDESDVSSIDLSSVCVENAEHLAVQSNKRTKIEPAVSEFQIAAVTARKIEVIALHLLRNAIDHAIETEEERLTAGKKAEARIRVELKTQDDFIVLKIGDDGRGIDWKHIERVARERNFLPANEENSAEKIRRLIFVGGFSTKKETTKVSGRGIGLEIVKREVEGLRGTIEVASEVGCGTTFTVRVRSRE